MAPGRGQAGVCPHLLSLSFPSCEVQAGTPEEHWEVANGRTEIQLDRGSGSSYNLPQPPQWGLGSLGGSLKVLLPPPHQNVVSGDGCRPADTSSGDGHVLPVTVPSTVPRTGAWGGGSHPWVTSCTVAEPKPVPIPCWMMVTQGGC